MTSLKTALNAEAQISDKTLTFMVFLIAATVEIHGIYLIIRTMKMISKIMTAKTIIMMVTDEIA